MASLGMDDALIDAVRCGDFTTVVWSCLACCRILLYSITSGTYTGRKMAGHHSGTVFTHTHATGSFPMTPLID